MRFIESLLFSHLQPIPTCVIMVKGHGKGCKNNIWEPSVCSQQTLGAIIVTDDSKCRHLEKMPDISKSISMPSLSICLHCCHLLGFLSSSPGQKPPPPAVSTKYRKNVPEAGLSQLICWRLDSWFSFHPFVLLIQHREQTKLPKWSCQRLPMTQELS